jgi:hypothetical protein
LYNLFSLQYDLKSKKIIRYIIYKINNCNNIVMIYNEFYVEWRENELNKKK